MLLSGSFARAQDRVVDFTQPILVLNPQGHLAPIRALVFTPDGRQLLSGGFDKVVQVWDLNGGRSTLSATIRPPIWRGLAGSVYAMALSANPQERGQRILAVAGYGVSSRRGGIMLYRFPGSTASRTGDPFGLLLNDDPKLNDDPNQPGATGHSDVVTSLAFDPTGTILASGSGERDGTIRIWDWKNRRSSAVLKDHEGAVNVVAFTPDGRFLVSGGSDGILRLWDLRQSAAPVARALPQPSLVNDPFGIQINALAVSGDGRWVVIGREDGRLIRYDARTLANPIMLSAQPATIEALALSHDGTLLATTSINRLRAPAEFPSFACSVQVRNMPDGRNPREVLKLDNIAYACAFSPDDRTLAVAGDDRQSLVLLRNENNAWQPRIVLKGTGSSVWDVGLRVDADGRLAVGFSQQPDQNPLSSLPKVTRRYHGFNLPDREITSFDPTELTRALREFEGWTIRPTDQYTLEVAHAAAPVRRFSIRLDKAKDRRWMAYTFVPPGPDHPRATVAVGCDSGVWFYRLEDGKPTHLFSGHTGPVYCLAPSKDSRWLATGSSDQTVRIWTLARCDTAPTLGAEFARLPDRSDTVKTVAPFSFADAMGLQPGDVPVNFGLEGKVVRRDEFFARFESVLPNNRIELIVRRRVGPAVGPPLEEQIALGTSRRDSPAASLFIGEDREWVVWMPSGYYDTSIAGDTKLLGWHINPPKLVPPRPVDFLEIIKFERVLRQPKRSQPNKLDTLLRTANLELAMAVPFPPPAEFVAQNVNNAANVPLPPPRIPPVPAAVVKQWQPPDLVVRPTVLPRQRIADIAGVAVNVQEPLPKETTVDNTAADASQLGVRIAIDAEGRLPATSLKVELDGRTIRTSRFDQPVALRDEPLILPISPGPHRLSAEIENERGIKRTVTRDVVVRGPLRTVAGRVKILTLAPTFQDSQIPPVKFADRDVKDLRSFLRKHLVSPLHGRPPYPIDEVPLDGEGATVDEVIRSFDELSREPLTEEDLVVVVIESHLLNLGRERKIAASDGRNVPPDPSIPADKLARLLGQVVKTKCRVVVLLDGVHTRSSQLWDTEINEWVRELRDRHSVITFVASNSGPSRAINVTGHRAFAQAVLDSARTPATAGPLSLDDFRDRVIEDVLNRTGRQQQAACYLPDTLNGRFPLLDPRPETR
jgi:WD40 repeat protein